MKLGKSLQIDCKLIANRGSNASGQTMAEYAVVLGVITLAIVTTIASLSGSIQTLLNEVTGLLT